MGYRYRNDVPPRAPAALRAAERAAANTDHSHAHWWKEDALKPQPVRTSPEMPHLGQAAAPRQTMEELVRQARVEMARYRRNQAHDDRYAFEIFRRSVAENDGSGWRVLLWLYGPQVAAWCSRASNGRQHNLDDLTARTWERFWRTYTPEKLAHAHGLAGVLRYLKLCAISVVMDAGREQSIITSLDRLAGFRADDAPAPADLAVDDVAQKAFWQIVQARLHDETERVVVYLRYVMGCRPADIHVQRPDLFPSVQEVYRVTRNILDRLRRCDELRGWRERHEFA